MHSQGERLRGSGKVKMTQKAPVSICASAQLRSGEVGASPQFRLVLSAVAAGEWRGAASPGLPLGPGWGCLPGSAPGSRRGLAFPWVCPWVRDGARVSLGLPLGPGWGHLPGSAPGSGRGLAFLRVCPWVPVGACVSPSLLLGQGWACGLCAGLAGQCQSGGTLSLPWSSFRTQWVQDPVAGKRCLCGKQLGRSAGAGALQCNKQKLIRSCLHLRFVHPAS